MSLHSTRIRLAGFETRALCLDALPERPRLLCLHGWGDSADAYKPLFSAIEGEFSAVALDAPGHGEASSERGGARLPQWIDLCRAAIEHCEHAAPLILIGQSFGARAVLSALAGDAAARRRVARVIAIAPAPLQLPPWQRVFVRNRALAEGVASLSAGSGPEQAIAAVVERHRRTSFHAPESLAASVFEDYARHVSIERAARSVDELRQIGEELQQPLSLAELSAPVDIVWGRQDRLAPLSGAQDYLAVLPHAQLEVIDDCGHHAHIEAPQRIAALLRRAGSSGDQG